MSPDPDDDNGSLIDATDSSATPVTPGDRQFYRQDVCEPQSSADVGG
jgi:hypothetical protein